ncbi:YozE family protein [Staphylococcus succinus]|uniref:YozE family protein n=1 Tax=Staphylococcus succinus TaxID=61015 RepID=UPI00248155A1|nr:YozE family protein [Staphylococcus succinus]MDH9161471.1 YozE family protein [Staphylococcus succinus]
MSFYDYILNYIDDDDKFGDLAKDVEQDNYFPINEKDIDKLRDYFDSVIDSNRIKEVAFESLEYYSKGKWI